MLLSFSGAPSIENLLSLCLLSMLLTCIVIHASHSLSFSLLTSFFHWQSSLGDVGLTEKQQQQKSLRDVIQDNPLWVIVNKIDLIPEVHRDHIRSQARDIISSFWFRSFLSPLSFFLFLFLDQLTRSLSRSLFRMHLHSHLDLSIKRVLLASAYEGTGVKILLSKIEKSRKERDVYILGSVNAGKTSLLNRIGREIGIGGIRVCFSPLLFFVCITPSDSI